MACDRSVGRKCGGTNHACIPYQCPVLGRPSPPCLPGASSPYLDHSREMNSHMYPLRERRSGTDTESHRVRTDSCRVSNEWNCAMGTCECSVVPRRAPAKGGVGVAGEARRRNLVTESF